MKTFVVPQSVQQAAARARADHQRTVLPEQVGGVAVAEALETGRVDEAVVKRMRRFFTTQARHFSNVQQLQHTFENSALMRSWALHGGEAGRVWSERVYAEARRDGLVEADPYVELLRAPVEEVYARLSLGAWRWEYDMDPPRAARFVEEYHRATGWNLDLDKAFGTGRNVVAKAMMRRAMNESPFKQLARALARAEYRKAAQLDLAEVKHSIGRPALNWPEFVGFVVLGAHAHNLLEPLLREGREIPLVSHAPAPIFEYVTPVASYVSFFHPGGAMFEEAAVSSATRMYMARLMWDLSETEVCNSHVARQTLDAARTELGRQGLAAGVGHVLIEAWARQDWQFFEDAIPLDSPVREPFLRFRQDVDPQGPPA